MVGFFRAAVSAHAMRFGRQDKTVEVDAGRTSRRRIDKVDKVEGLLRGSHDEGSG